MRFRFKLSLSDEGQENIVGSIKQFRAAFGTGLKESKDIIDRLKIIEYATIEADNVALGNILIHNSVCEIGAEYINVWDIREISEKPDNLYIF